MRYIKIKALMSQIMYDRFIIEIIILTNFRENTVMR